MKDEILKKDVSSRKKYVSTGLPVYHPKAAGIDIGDSFHEVAICDENGIYEVRKFDAFTENLKQLVDWLLSEGISTAAIESTGVYWLNLYLLLEESGIEPYLVNAHHVKNVTGRKKDDTDAMWIQKLHSCALLNKSFQPEAEIRTLRTYVRHRKNLITICSDSVRRMQKSLELMNIKLHIVISDLLGKTGMLMVKAILAGERDPYKLLAYKDSRIKASDELIVKALTGIWKEDHLFTLQQAYEEYQFYQRQIASCDEKIIECLQNQVAKVQEGDITVFLTLKKAKKKKNEFTYPISKPLAIVFGVDICEVEGVSEITALELLSEIGTDMTKWRSEKHFSSWLNVAPNTKITGGKVISSKMRKKKNIAGQALRMSASNLSSCKSPIGDYSRKMKAKLGKKGGVVATAHKLSRIIYIMIKEKTPYDKELIAKNNDVLKEKKIKFYEKKIEMLKKAV